MHLVVWVNSQVKGLMVPRDEGKSGDGFGGSAMLSYNEVASSKGGPCWMIYQQQM